MPIVESTLGVVRMRVVDQTTGLPAWITLNTPAGGSDIYVAGDETAMLAILPKYADCCVRTDRNMLFYYGNPNPPAAPPTVAADWLPVSWSDAQVVADQAAMLALTTADPGDFVYDSLASELYIRIDSGGDGSLITDWLKIGSRPNIHLNVADETAMIALVAEKGDLALRSDENATYALHANPATDVLNWAKLPGGTPLPGPGISIGPDPTTGNALIQVNTGAGIMFEPAVAPDTADIAINLGAGNTTLPQALEIKPYDDLDPTNPDNDVLQVKELGIKDIHIGASLGAMVDVNYSSVSGAPSPATRQDGWVLTWDSTFVDPVSGAVGQWISKAPAGTSGAVWNYAVAATGAVDPGAGNLTAISDGLTPPTWTFEISNTDVEGVVHNLMVMSPGDTLTITDNPLTPPITAYQRFSLVSEPVSSATWITVTATPIDTSIGVAPVVGTEVKLYGTFGQGGLVKALSDLLDVETTGTPGYPAGPVGAEVLRFDPNGGGAGVPLWVPGPDTHVVFTPIVGQDEPLLPDGTGLPVGSIWISPDEVAPVSTNAPNVWKSWSGTQPEFDALGVYDSGTLYAII
jgi:hypothetical protein